MAKYLDYQGLGQYTSILNNYITRRDNQISANFNSQISSVQNTATSANNNANQAISLVNDILDAYPVKLVKNSDGSYTLQQGSDAGDWVTIGTINVPESSLLSGATIVSGTWTGSSFIEGKGNEKALKLTFKGQDPIYIDTAGFGSVSEGEGITVNGSTVSCKFGDGATDVASGARVAALEALMFKKSTSYNAGISPGTIEYGVDTKVTVSWSVYTVDQKNGDNGTTRTPTAISVKKNGTEVHTDATTPYTDTISDSQQYVVLVTYNGATQQRTVGVTAIDRIYMGYSDKDSIAGGDLASLEPGIAGYHSGYGGKTGFLKTSVAGTYATNGRGYFYIAIPSNCSGVSKITSGGFYVPFSQVASDVTVAGKKNKYIIYRIDGKIVATSNTFVISC